MKIKNWSRDDSLGADLLGDSNVKAWHNETVNECVVRGPTESEYALYYYTRPSLTRKKPTGRKGHILFRDSNKRSLDSRAAKVLRQYPSGIDPEAVQREELNKATNLSEWANKYGALFVGTEKIGNCKESNGDAAIFDGSVRRGNGAYVSFASELGPRGKSYVSIGRESNGYYTVTGTRKPRRGAIEVIEPENTEFKDNGTIVVTSRDGKKIKVKPTEKGVRTEAWKSVL